MNVVVVDANAIVERDWQLKSASWRVLLSGANADLYRLVVPEVVVREVRARYSESLAKAVSNSEAQQRTLQRLGVERPILPIDVEARSVIYESELRATIAGVGGEIPVLDDVDLYALVEKAAHRQRPFDDKGNGFRDALLWEHVVRLIAEGDAVTLISHDRRAFYGAGAEPELVQELQNELAERGHPAEAAALYPDVGSYVKAHNVADRSVEHRALQITQNESSQIETNIEYAIRCASVELRSHQGRVAIDYIPTLNEVAVIDVSTLDANSLALVTFEVTFDADISVEWWDVSYPGASYGTKTLTATVQATFDAEDDTLDDFSAGTIWVDFQPSDFNNAVPELGYLYKYGFPEERLL